MHILHHLKDSTSFLDYCRRLAIVDDYPNRRTIPYLWTFAHNLQFWIITFLYISYVSYLKWILIFPRIQFRRRQFWNFCADLILTTKFGFLMHIYFHYTALFYSHCVCNGSITVYYYLFSWTTRLLEWILFRGWKILQYLTRIKFHRKCQIPQNPRTLNRVNPRKVSPEFKRFFFSFSLYFIYFS